uniref:Zinc transporter ZIP3 n=1 Tax=Ditylenchus dipsaci TaxID=166011 RepID=A0A915DL76_9BILA
MEQVVIIKLLLLIVMGILPLIFGLLPLKIVDLLSKTEGKRSLQLSSLFISILSCFAGGVVLAVSLIELFPEAREGLSFLQEQDPFYHSYPFVELLCVWPCAVDVSINDSKGFNRNGGSSSRSDRNSTNYNSMEQTGEMDDAETGAIRTVPTSMYSSKDIDVEKRKAIVSAVTLVLAMSVHTSLEGFAFGIQNRLVGIYSLFFGILIHKILVFFSIGISLTQSLLPRRSLILILVTILSTFSPLGGVVGILVETSQLENHSKVLVTTILTSLSIGTFLYIALFEIISAERGKEHSKLLQWAGCTFGFILMAVVLSFFSHQHTPTGHSHHSHSVIHTSPTSVD